MSIRPVDYTSLIPKSQEVTKIRQVENEKYRNQIEIGVTQQQKQIKENIKRVRDTNKTENLIIDANKKNKKKKKETDSNRNKKNKNDNNKVNKEILGEKIDIRI